MAAPSATQTTTTGPACSGCGRALDGEAGPRASAHRAWFTLFASSWLAAGHGVFLLFALTRDWRLLSMQDMGGGKTALVVLFFIASVPVALATLLLRRRLCALPPRPLGIVALLWCAATALVWVAYLARISGVSIGPS